MIKKNKRTPRNYCGTNSSIRTIQELLPITYLGIEEKYLKQPKKIIESWPEVIGEKLAKMTKVISLKGGVLTVMVKSSTLLSILSHHEKQRLLIILQKKFSKAAISDINFTIG